MSDLIKVRPPVKWAGGKGGLLDQLLPLVPKTFGRYIEPFVGGGAMFFALQPDRAVLSDSNGELMNVYFSIRDRVEDVIKILGETPVNEETFYDLRKNIPDYDMARRAARTIFLNKTCFTPGSMVLTEDEEYIAIETVTVGQKLWGGKRVQEVLTQKYKGTVLRIRLQSNPFTLSVTEDHPVLSIAGRPKGTRSDHRTVQELTESIDLKSARDLRIGDYVLLPTTGTKESSVDWAQFWPPDDTVGPQAQEAILDTTDEVGLCRLLGYYAAQGCVGYQYGRVSRVDLAFNSEKVDDIEDATALCKKIFRRTPIVSRIKGKRLVNVTLSSVYASRFIHALVPGQSWAKDPAKRKTKRLNSVLMHMPVALQLELLRGWFRGDGGFDHNESARSYTLTGTCTVPPMARQMYRLAQRCGFRPSWWVTYPKTKSHPEGDATCQVALCISEEVARLTGKVFPTGRKGVSCAHRRFVDGYIAVRIKDITQLDYDGTVHNLEVDGDHLLCVDGVVSHNCFNGLFRVNKKGEFNVSWGKKDPKAFPAAYDFANLRACSRVLQGISLWEADYRQRIWLADKGDFVYLDPPYAPVSKTSNFTSYTADKFGPKDQERVAEAFADMSAHGVKLMLSNADTPEMRKLYRGFRIDTVHARRNVNCNGAKRGKVNEIVVRNYGGKK